MRLKNIYLVQAGEKYLIKNRTAYLPYAVGTIAAKAWNHKVVQNSFNLDRIVFLREPIEQMVDSLDDPFLVGFSSYIWNHEYNKAAAKQIKLKFPDCLIVFGGHNVPSDTSLFEECNYIDIVIHGEGEEVFEKLLCALATDAKLSNIPNISYRHDNLNFVQTSRMAITGFDYPSPYTFGIFDRIIREHPDIEFHGTLETNRGCSNNCAFCDWGPHKIKVKVFPLERVKLDIDWLSKNKIEYIWGTDANFGQFERDSQIADWMIEAKNKNGYPNRFRANYAKHNNRNVFELAKRFSDAGLSKSTTISLQSLSSEALKNVGRSNMTLESFSELITLYRSAGIPTYSEMILALPGETYDSFTSGIGRLLDSGQHSVIEVYDCVLLANSALAEKDYIDRYQIKTIRTPFFQYHCESPKDDIVEYNEIVISTKTMSEEDWMHCKLFSIAVQSMHCLGLLRCFSIFLHNEKHIPYNDFYITLVQWFLTHPGTLGFDVFTQIYKQLQLMLSEKKVPYYYNERFGDVRWPLDEGAFLSFVFDIDRFYEEIIAFLKHFNIEENIFDQLLNYQKSIICIPKNKATEITLKYDFYNYILQSMNNDYMPLKKVKNKVLISPNDSFISLAEYARETVWYGRRLGKTIYTSGAECVKIEYC